MKIILLKYKSETVPKKNNLYKIFGCIWLFLGFTQIISGTKIGYLYFISGIFYIYPLFNKNPEIFATITNGIYKRNYLFSTKTDLTKAKFVKKFAGDVTFIFQHRELRIDGQLLDEESLAKLEEFVQNQQINSKVIPIR